MLAYWCRAFRRRGLLRTREILAHGTEEPIEFIERFDCVQHLTPWHMDQALQALRAMSPAASAPPAPGSTIPPHWVAIPNFVDTDVFAPLAADGDARRAAVRAAFGAPSRAFVVGCVAAVKKHHKRMDYLIGEFAEFRPGMPGSFSRPEPWLVIAGAKEDDSEELRALGEAFAPGRTRILLDLPRGRMPDLYRAMDVFVLTSLFEMMPISLLEALASGVPALTHQHPVFEWIAGDGGARLDMARPGALAGFIRQLTAGWLREHGQQARQRAVRMFSKSVAIGQYMDYYREVAAHVSP
jgi:glycosyltransferase involved in cell wall biosynthesis